MFLWDTNILRHFIEGHPTLRTYVKRIAWEDIALPSVVVAEVLRGRSEYALKASPIQAPPAHALLQETRDMLHCFHIVMFDTSCVIPLQQLREQHKHHKSYADMMIAAIAIAGKHTVVTRNRKHFASLLPKTQLANWIDLPPAS